MARDTEVEDTGADEAEHDGDSLETFSSAIAEKYAKGDAANEEDVDGEGEADDAADDGADDGDEAAESDGKEGADDDSDAADESADSDQADDSSDGDASDSDEDSAEERDDEAPDEESDSEDAEGDEDADGDKKPDAKKTGKKDGADDDADEDVSDDLKGAAERHGIPLTLEDVEDPVAKKVVAARLRQIDAGFTRAMQEARSGRKELAQLRSDKKFRDENAELVITEMLLSGGAELAERVNKRVEKLEDPDQKTAFEVVVKDKRRSARESVVTEMTDAEQQDTRADTVERLARAEAAKRGLPWRLAERAVVAAMKADSKTGRVDIGDDDVKAVIFEEFKAYNADLRSGVRDKSRQQVKGKMDAKKKLPPAKRTSSGQSPRPGAKKPVTVDQDDEDSRLSALDASAKRILARRGNKG